MEMEPTEITETTDLSNLGMDLWMTSIVLRKDHDIDLDPTILADNPSFSRMRKALGLEKQKPTAPAPAQENEVKTNIVIGLAAPPVEVVVQMPPAMSFLL
jgi:hypothetical protein